MAIERRRQAVLGVLLVVLAAVLFRAWNQPPPTATPAVSGGATRGQRSGPTELAQVTAPDVRLSDLGAERPAPDQGERNLFRFRPPPAPPPPVVTPPLAGQPGTGVAAGPPPVPPIPLKFIGIVEAPSQSKRLAALIDPMGFAYQGGEGDIVAGQYRVLRIGVESIEISYLDGRGRQVIRLSGS